MRIRTLLAALATQLCLSGCAAFVFDRLSSTEVSRKENFEHYWNQWIGREIHVEQDFKNVLLEKKELENKNLEFVLRQKDECRIALDVLNSGSVLESWRYLSEPKTCWIYVFHVVPNFLKDQQAEDAGYAPLPVTVRTSALQR